jgi:hypothetical protein
MTSENKTAKLLVPDGRTTSVGWTAVAYAAFVLLPVAGLIWVLHRGSALPPPINAAAVAAADSLPGSRVILHSGSKAGRYRNLPNA